MPAQRADPPPRRQLSLRWKSFLVLGLRLGVVHTFLGYLGYSNLQRQSEWEARASIDASSEVLETLLAQSARDVEIVARQIAAAISIDDLRGLQQAQLPDLFEELT